MRVSCDCSNVCCDCFHLDYIPDSLRAVIKTKADSSSVYIWNKFSGALFVPFQTCDKRHMSHIDRCVPRKIIVIIDNNLPYFLE